MRRTILVLLAATTAVALPGLVAGAQEAEPVRTEVEGIFGYNSGVQGSPLSILFFEDLVPIPTDPGEPKFEMTYSYTSTTLLTGPQSRAVASSVWPGPAFGDGFATICDCGEEWPIKADARYPSGEQQVDQTAPNGGGMTAIARGLDVTATADSNDPVAPQGAVTGAFRSTSTTTVEEGVNISTVDAAVQDVSLLGGLITVDGVRTVLRATSDGEAAATSGTTQVQGLTIAGNGYTVDEQGVRPVQEGEPGDALVPIPSELPSADELREQLGIQVELVGHTEAVEGTSARRQAGGLRITVDTSVLRSRVPLRDVVAPFPDDLEAELAPLLEVSPTIVYIFGRGSVRAAASPPFEFQAPTLPPPPPLQTAPSGSSGDFSVPAGSAIPGGAPAFTDSAPPVETAEPPPAVAAPAPAVAGVTDTPELFAGLPAGLLALGLAAAALGARALTSLTGLVLSGSGAACAAGADRGIPDLRTSEGR